MLWWIVALFWGLILGIQGGDPYNEAGKLKVFPSLVMDRSQTFSHQGIYSLPEAARLLRVSTSKLTNWANGYTYQRKYDRGEKAAVLQTDRNYPRVLNFRELFELMAVREFRKLGVQLEDLRRAAQRLAATLGTEYPFASEKMFLNGRQLVAEQGEGLISLSTGQLVMQDIELLKPELEFRDGLVARWHPGTGEGSVVLDPEIKFGDPILEERGIPTRTLFRLYQVEQDLEKVADYYQISVEELTHVIRFERSLKDAA